ncbi:MAG: glycosyltransferase family 4 protein [Aquabacterium sp.]|nr:glycosyltransferase family 4 protein [Ferruginibacter sp.]
MNLVLFTHPAFLAHQSMPRFSQMIYNGMISRGHQVEIWSPKARAFRLPLGNALKKWLGYIDQYILFPAEVKRKLKSKSSETLFVFSDQALGPWVPLVRKRLHVIHCHDFLAQRSALGEIPENITRWSGRQYQAYIRKGYLQGKNFISVSQKTRDDLARFLTSKPHCLKVVYNGMNQVFEPGNAAHNRAELAEKTRLNLVNGFVLHVGGNDWYKNRIGVIEIYNSWRNISKLKLPLVLIGTAPSETLQKIFEASPFKIDIHFLSGMNDELVRLAYKGASVFLFPSLAEGFGWPIAEAMASGCPVVTTNEAPMTEVAGDAAFLIPRRPDKPELVEKWANEAGYTINEVIGLTPEKRSEAIRAGLFNARRFDTQKAMDKIERLYQSICDGFICNEVKIEVQEQKLEEF